MPEHITHLFHINDVVAPGDTSNLRLEAQYACIAEQLNIKEPQIHLIPSKTCNSEHTLKQLLYLLAELDKTQSNGKHVIAVNNASRAGHKDSGNAKGSDCFWASIQLPGSNNKFEVVGYHVLEQFQRHINALKRVKGITFNGVTVPDISQGSQFRSLEYLPLVQLLIHNNLAGGHLHTEIIPTTSLQLAQTIQNYDIDPDNAVKIIGYNGSLSVSCGYKPNPVSHELRLGEFPKWFQLQGQRDKFYKDRGIQQKGLGHQKPENIELPDLKANQVVLFDKDKFCNNKTLSAHADGIYGIVRTLGVELGSRIKVQWECDGKITTDSAYLVESISDKTGEKCIRNGSSRGPNGEILVEMNRSFDETNTPWEEIKDVPVGTVISFSKP